VLRLEWNKTISQKPNSSDVLLPVAAIDSLGEHDHQSLACTRKWGEDIQDETRVFDIHLTALPWNTIPGT
jgi:hypothetical protein